MISLLSLLLAFLAGYLLHWYLTRKQRKLLKAYKYYKTALARVDQAMLVDKRQR